MKCFDNLIYRINNKYFKFNQSYNNGPKESFHEFIKNLYLNYGAQWEEINVFGIRDTSNMEKDVFNDFIGICIYGEVELYRATTDPSVYYTKIGFDGKGVAHLCLGYHKDAYMIGLHKNEYKAMVQWGGPVTIWRDGNNNFTKDSSDIVEKGYFGINIHRASLSHDVQTIGKYSAGCQVIQKISDYNNFMNKITTSLKYLSNKKSKFSYMLFDKSQIPERYLSDYS